MHHRTPLALLLLLACTLLMTGCQSSEIYETQVRNIRIVADSIDHNATVTRTIPVAVPQHVTSTVEVFGDLDRPDRLRWNWEFNNIRTIKNYYFENGVIILYTYQTYTLPPKPGQPAALTISSRDYDSILYFTDDKSRSRERFPEGEALDKLLRQTHADNVKLR